MADPMVEGNTPIVTVVIVNWNRYQDTCDCVESLLSQREVLMDLIVVDNGSTDDLTQSLREKYSQIQILRSEKNLGFAGGYNLGIREALRHRSNQIMIINNDTVADELMVKELLFAMDSSKVGICAPLIYYYAEPTRVWSSGGYINKLVLMPIGSHHEKETLSSSVDRTFLSGCCYLMRRELINQVGLFDERFFLYLEDLDYCLRVMQTDWKMKVVPAAKLYHKVSSSSNGYLSSQERYYYGLSSGLYYRKYLNYKNIWFIVPFRIISALLWTCRLITSGNFSGLAAYYRGLWQGWIKSPLAAH